MPRALLVVAFAVSVAGCGDLGANAPPYYDLANLEFSVSIPPDLTRTPANDDGGSGGGSDGGQPDDMTMVNVSDDLSGQSGPDAAPDFVTSTCARIVIHAPALGTMLIGNVAVDIEITSNVGIIENTVAVTLGAANGLPGGLPIKVVRVPGTDHFQGLVNVRALPGEFVFPVLSISVDDKEGRHCTGESPVYKVDFVGPAIDFDPPLISQVVVQNGVPLCSYAFDPVGNQAANEGEAILQLSTLRARLEDRYSAAPGQTVGYYSLIKKGSTKLYLLPQPSVEPLVISNAGDGICDDINPKVIPVQGAMGPVATEVGLGPLDTSGIANFFPSRAFKAPGAEPICDLNGFSTGDPNAKGPPVSLCGDLTIHLGYTANRMEASIYSISPPFPAPPAPGCDGTQFDAANSKLPEGPLCVAAVAMDNAGNRSVSRPLHVCYDKGNGKCDAYSHRDGLGRIIPPVKPGPYPDCGVGVGPNKCLPGVRLNIPKPNTNDYRGDPFPNLYEVY